MLPDYPETKRLFARFFQTYMRQKARQLSPFGVVQTRYLHEGRGMKVTRADHSESDSQVQQLSTEFTIRFEEIEHLTFEKVIQKYDEVILDMVKKQTGFALERLDSEIPDSQKIDAKGKPLDARMVIELFRTMELEFNPDGTPHTLHVVGGLFNPERMKAVEEEMKNNPELEKEFNDVIAEKREKWRAREADRKLVG